jgi:hypothetical protein
MQSRRTASLEVTVAAALGIATGLASAWIVFSIHLPAYLNYLGLFPTVASLVVFGANTRQIGERRQAQFAYLHGSLFCFKVRSSARSPWSDYPHDYTFT